MSRPIPLSRSKAVNPVVRTVVLAWLGFLNLQGAFGSDLFPTNEFVFLNIVPYSPGCEVLAAQDSVEYRQRTGNDIVLYSLTLHPEGVPAMDKVDAAVKSYRAFVRCLEGSGVRPGILVQAILGHWPRVDKEIEPWQRSVNLKGRETRFCPLDPRFRTYIREVAVKLAKERPNMMLLDDDMRSFSEDYECFCPLHAAEYCRRTGMSLSSEEYRQKIAKADFWSPERQAFLKLQRDTIDGVARLFRESVSSVAPTLPMGACQPGVWDERLRAVDYAQSLAAVGQVPFLRLANGTYIETSPKTDLHSKILDTMAAIAVVSPSVPVLLDEADTWPHNAWAKSAVAMHAKLTVGAFCGLRGAKLWFVNCHKNGEPVNRHYTDILAAHHGYYSAIVSNLFGSSSTGIAIPCFGDYPFSVAGWAERMFGVFGVPFRPVFNFREDAVYALAGESLIKNRLKDDQIREMLSHRVLLDGDAAAALAKRGFSADIGVACADRAIRFTAERDETTNAFVDFPMTAGARTFEPGEGTEVLSSLVWQPYRGAARIDRVAPAVTFCRNRLGGRVIVTAYHMHMGEPYSYSESRQKWLRRILMKLSDGLPDGTSGSPQNVMTLVRRGVKGEAYVFVVNLNFDPLEEIVLSCAEEPVRVSVLSPQGRWEGVSSARRNGSVVIKKHLPCYGECIVRMLLGI